MDNSKKDFMLAEYTALKNEFLEMYRRQNSIILTGGIGVLTYFFAMFLASDRINITLFMALVYVIFPIYFGITVNWILETYFGQAMMAQYLGILERKINSFQDGPVTLSNSYLYWESWLKTKSESRVYLYALYKYYIFLVIAILFTVEVIGTLFVASKVQSGDIKLWLLITMITILLLIMFLNIKVILYYSKAINEMLGSILESDD